jgi:hypothetical protein
MTKLSPQPLAIIRRRLNRERSPKRKRLIGVFITKQGKNPTAEQSIQEGNNIFSRKWFYTGTPFSLQNECRYLQKIIKRDGGVYKTVPIFGIIHPFTSTSSASSHHCKVSTASKAFYTLDPRCVPAISKMQNKPVRTQQLILLCSVGLFSISEV